jgi:hypothetical protein
MAYTASQIIAWAKLSQPYARYGEMKKKAQGDNSANLNLDIELYITRKDVEYANAQDPSSADTYQQANYLLTLCGIYLFQAQEALGAGGSTATTTQVSAPSPYYFIVDASTSFMLNGATTKTITSFIGYNLVYSRNGIIQTTVTSEPTYFSWNSVTGAFVTTPALITGELIGLVPT